MMVFSGLLRPQCLRLGQAGAAILCLCLQLVALFARDRHQEPASRLHLADRARPRVAIRPDRVRRPGTEFIDILTPSLHT